jgi:putative ABC transport system substrate-binding protein
MNRRALMLLLSVTVAIPGVLRAQQKAMPVVGYLGAGSPDQSAATVIAFRQGLSETRYIDRQNRGNRIPLGRGQL